MSTDGGERARHGPLAGLRLLEMGGIGPGPFAAMMLADMGADVVRVERPDAPITEDGATVRGRRVLRLDLKRDDEAQAVLELARNADVLIEGFRPGTMERLGFGPERILTENPALVYARMTGWGQTGPLASVAGHDINYIAITGALAAIGPKDGAPVVPLNLVGDYGGGALYLIAGILAARIEAVRSGRGQVVDCAICDGVVSMLSLFHRLSAGGGWSEARGNNLLDGGAPFYTTYACSDGRRLAVGALEPQFYAALRDRAGWADPLFDQPRDSSRWAAMRRQAEALMRTRTCDEWLALFAGSDACVTPVLSLAESARHPHLVAREAFVEVGGELQPAPAPRFSHTPSVARQSVEIVSPQVILQDWG